MTISHTGLEAQNLPPAEQAGIAVCEYPYGVANIIEAVSQRDVSEITFVAQDGQQFLLNSLLPAGFSFQRNRRTMTPSTSVEDGIIEYGDEVPDRDGSVKSLWRPGGMLTLLHEIGHAKLDAPVTIERLRALHYMNPANKNTVPGGDSSAVHDVLSSERNAWAYALGELRHLRHEGIDLEPELPNLNSIIPGIHGSLLTYEAAIAETLMTDKELASDWQSARQEQLAMAKRGELPRELARYALLPHKPLPSTIPPATK